MLYTVEGQYYVMGQFGKTLGNFTEQFELDPNEPAPLHIIQRKLINSRLLEKDANSAGFRTCAIIKDCSGSQKIQPQPEQPLPLDSPTGIEPAQPEQGEFTFSSSITKQELLDFAFSNKLPVDLDMIENCKNFAQAKKIVKDAYNAMKVVQAKLNGGK